MDIIREWDFSSDNPPHKIEAGDASLSLEIGCGNGLFLSTIAAMYPQHRFVGLEVKHKCLVAAAKKCDRLILAGQISAESVVLINGDVFTATDKFFADGTLDNIYINFPDPWFKKRHLKKRIINTDMIAKYSAKLKAGGVLYFVTDNFAYLSYAIDTIVKSSLFDSRFEPPYYTDKLDAYPQSLYEKKWREEGRNVYYTMFVKKQ